MSELDRETLRQLELARELRTPTASDRARVRQRLVDAGIPLSSGRAAHVQAASASTTGGRHPATTAGNDPRPAGPRVVFGSAAALWILGGVCAASAMVGGMVVVATLSEPQGPRTQAGAVSETHPEPRAGAALADPTLPILAPALDVRPEPAREPDEAARPDPVGERRPPARAGDSLAAELELLHVARAAWRRGEPARALSLLDTHRGRHGASAVTAEREALRVLCLCDLGRQRAARRVARRWLREAPLSPLRAAVEGSCAFE